MGGNGFGSDSAVSCTLLKAEGAVDSSNSSSGSSSSSSSTGETDQVSMHSPSRIVHQDDKPASSTLTGTPSIVVSATMWPTGLVGAKMLARSGFRCACHFLLAGECPGGDL